MRLLIVASALLAAFADADLEADSALGCCVGTHDKCNQDKKSKCKKMANKHGHDCSWSTDPTVCDFGTPEPGCCFGTHAHCETDDEAKCLKRASKYDCEWRGGADADCSAGPGCCLGAHAHCETDDSAKCMNRAGKGCEWMTGDDCGDVTTAAPACTSSHRHRKSWQESSKAEQQLYIDGFKALADQGVMRKFTQTHWDSSEHSNAEFLPWHREYVYRLESAIRDLGGEFSCFTLPYWDWSREPMSAEVLAGKADLYILQSGLGGDSNGQCLTDNVWGRGYYEPLWEECLKRDLDYPHEPDMCRFWQSTEMMELIDWSSEYSYFRPYLEGSPHALPHICIGGDEGNHMATFYSPDDPIFYLHHCFIDFIWALWQDCNDYEGTSHSSWSVKYDSNVNFQLSFSPIDRELGFSPPRVSETFDIVNDYDVSYAKGQFWNNAKVDGTDQQGRFNCLAGINSNWFYDEVSIPSVEAAVDDDSLLAQCSALTGTAVEVGQQCCQLVQEASGTVCSLPDDMSGALDPSIDATTGKPFERNPDTGDIVISLELITDELGAYGLPDCVAEFRAKMYPWAVMMDQLEDLQNGCYDPTCEPHAAGCFNGDAHPENAPPLSHVLSAMVQSAVSENANLVVLVMAAMTMAMLMALKATGCGTTNNKVSTSVAGYGSTV